MKDFRVILPLHKEAEDFLTGIASATSVDRDSEKMSEKALEDMRREILLHGVNLFGNHQHEWENILGGIAQADILGKELKVGINLNKSNPKYAQLLGTISTKGVKVGMSIGGAVTKERFEYDKELDKRIKVIDGVKLYEVSVVGIPSNSDSFLSMPEQIIKSMKQGHWEWVEKTCPVCLTKCLNNKTKCDICLTEL